jgi:DNA segregation ATPase FtsK/SpoIIIE, S-DNA-T family
LGQNKIYPKGHVVKLWGTAMAKGDKRRSKAQDNSGFDIATTLSSEVFRGIWAVLAFLITLYLILAALNMAGLIGEQTYGALFSLFGVGYFLLPFVTLGIGVSFLRPLEESVAGAKWVGAVLFFLSGLSLIEILFKSGGFLGSFLASPLIALFDTIAAVLILTGILIISIILTLEVKLTTLSLKNVRAWFTKTDATPTVIGNDAPEPEGGVGEVSLPLPGEDDEVPVPQEPYLARSESAQAPSFAPVRGMVYHAPPLSLLEKDRGKPGQGDIKANANLLKRTLQNFGIDVEIDEISIGPTVTRYALKPAEDVRLSKIVSLQTNLELALAAHPIRIEAPIPGRSLVGIEVPNSAKATVGLATLLGTETFQKSEKSLLMALGKDIVGQAHYADLSKMPHLLIAGTTGSGKSVTIHTLITSLLYRNSPEMLRFIMIDPKRVELTLYNGIPHLKTPVITDAKKAIQALKYAAREMDARYNILEAESVRDIASYHRNVLAPALKRGGNPEKMPKAMPYLVIVIDELADIMQTYPRELEAAIVRLAQMSRAVGIHLMLSTQRPSVNVITGLIKANIPSRIALQVSSQIDSRTILDGSGAEKLLGAGDMLYLSGEMSKPTRIQSAFVGEQELKRVREYIIENNEPELPEDITALANGSMNPIFEASEGGEDDDELYEEARAVVMQAGKASTSFLQRRLRLGYARAARLVDLLEERGVIGPGSGAKPREVLMRSSGGTSPLPDEISDNAEFPPEGVEEKP